MRGKWIVGLLVVSGMAVSWGCHRGPVTSSVHGEITLDGKPIDGGQITFVPAGAGAVPAQATIEGGKYEIKAAKGPSVGKCKIEVRWSKKTGRKIQAPPAGEVEETRQIIPAAYNDKSTLSFEIKPGDNVYSSDLKSK
jgi:hypothetical protein